MGLCLFGQAQADMGNQVTVFVGLLKDTVTIAKLTLLAIQLKSLTSVYIDGLQRNKQITELYAVGTDILNRCSAHITWYQG